MGNPDAPGLPMLHVTNWSSRKLHGLNGRKWTIMRNPRAWEFGGGRVEALTPSADDLDGVRRRSLPMPEYMQRCEARFRSFRLWPGVLSAGIAMNIPVASGDTLLCACGREAAARGECHRVVAARLLVEAGWNVLLDGVQL